MQCTGKLLTTLLTHQVLFPSMSLQISANGIILFGGPQSVYGPFPTSGPKLIAPFYADIGANISGEVFYRSSTNTTDLSLASMDVQNGFASVDSSLADFNVTSVLIVTWDSIGHPDIGSLVRRLCWYQASPPLYYAVKG